MNVVVVPGIHPSTLTHEFIQAVHPCLNQAWIVPGQQIPVYSPQHVLTFLREQWEQMVSVNTKTRHDARSVLFIGFSAGVVGSIGAARQWQAQGGQVRALIVFDGWGVPLYGDFPIHRVSHDAWTHWSSGYFGNTQASFYADPPVAHLELWRSPHTASGIRTDSKPSNAQPSNAQPLETAADFVRSLLAHYSKQP